MLTSLKSRIALGFAAAALVSAPAFAKPDLAIADVKIKNRTDISCATGDPLITVRVLIDNKGEDKADFGARRSVVGGAIDDAPYTWKLALTANDIDAGEREGYDIEIGEGDVKSGRIGEVVGGVSPFVPSNATEQNRLPRDLKVRIQEELIALGHLSGRADGSLGSGSRSAIRKFQASRGEAETGVLTLAQTDALLAGGKPRSSYFGAEREFYIVIVVDPNSRIDEADEGNNVGKFGPFKLSGC